MESGGGFGNQSGEQIAIGPIYVFEINLEAAISVPPALAEKRVDECRLGRFSREQLVEFKLSHESHDGHDGHVVHGCGPEHVGIRTSPDEAIAIDRVPGGHEDVDFVGVLDEGLHRVGSFNHVKESFRLGGSEDGGGEKQEKGAHDESS